MGGVNPFYISLLPLESPAGLGGFFYFLEDITEVTLTGFTTDGMEIEGTDTVRIVPLGNKGTKRWTKNSNSRAGSSWLCIKIP